MSLYKDSLNLMVLEVLNNSVLLLEIQNFLTANSEELTIILAIILSPRACGKYVVILCKHVKYEHMVGKRTCIIRGDDF